MAENVKVKCVMRLISILFYSQLDRMPKENNNTVFTLWERLHNENDFVCEINK